MQALSSTEIRQRFVAYFKERGHTHVPSSSLIPEGKDLLFTNAGMNQFKNIFLGLEQPTYKRAVSVQKCFRATDLDQVGRTPRHHTFFEMLGNFSFGDYFKKEAIEYAWDFLTNPEHLGIPADRLYVTVFEGGDGFDRDVEAFEIWKKYVPEERIKWCGAEDNFWRMASTGPCGPCSEIFYHYGGQDVEIWNLVFMQYNQISKDQREKLPKPCVDTGAGLERLTAVMQGVESNFETDIFMSIFHFILWEKIQSQKDILKRPIMDQLPPKLEFFLKDLFQKVLRTNIEDFYKNGILPYLPHLDPMAINLFHLAQWQPSKNILLHLQEGKYGCERQRFLGFLCKELQKDRSQEDFQGREIDRGKMESDRIALFQIADHIRAMFFLLNDEVVFSNEGRGYILKEIFKKTYECLDQIGIDVSNEYCLQKIMVYFVRSIIDEDKMRREDLSQLNFLTRIIGTISHETIRYQQERAKSHQDIFNKAFEKKFKTQKPTSKQIGTFAFECYETYGISKNNVKTYLQNKNIIFDKECEDVFEKTLKKAQEHSRNVSQKKYLTQQKEHLTKLASLAKTSIQADEQKTPHFVGYNKQCFEEAYQTQVVKLSDGQRDVPQLQGEKGFVFFKQTPFYAESGGQVADQGLVKNASEQVIAKITDCQKYADLHCHHITLNKEAYLKEEDQVILEINKTRRAEATKHHTATHLLYASLKKHLEVLVNEKEQDKMASLYPNIPQQKAEVVVQRGSYVADDHLRFDFTYSKPLSSEQKQNIEEHINQQIAKALPVRKTTMSLKEAKDQGALAFFAEKYPADNARVVNVGERESFELCGGTHVDNTNEIQSFVITQEENISAGVRRIKAIAGQKAVEYLLDHNRAFQSATREAQTDPQNLTQWIKSVKQDNKRLHKQMEKLLMSEFDVEKLMEKSISIDGGQQIQVLLETEDRKFLSQIVDRIKNKLKDGVVVLFGKSTTDPNKNPLLVGVTKSLVKQYPAPQILKQYGVGGGRPDFAQGYYKQASFNLEAGTLNTADEKTQGLLEHLKDLRQTQ